MLRSITLFSTLLLTGSSMLCRAQVSLFPVTVDLKVGFIDSAGAVVIQPRYLQAAPFSDGLSRVKTGVLSSDGTHDLRWGYIDVQGTFRSFPGYEEGPRSVKAAPG